MRVAVDAHAIGRHLTGNEVYVRSLLNALASGQRDCEFIAYISSAEAAGALAGVDLHAPHRQEPVCAAGIRPGAEGARRPAGPAARAVHGPAGLCHAGSSHGPRREFPGAPGVFHPQAGAAIAMYRGRTVKRAAKILTPTEFSRRSILKVYGDLDEDKVVVVPNAAGPAFRPLPREAAAPQVASGSAFPRRSCWRWEICSRARTRSA